MKSIGLDARTGGGRRSDAARLRDQMNRLFRATISFEYSDESVTSFSNLLIADNATIFWTPTAEDQPALWESRVELSERFYDALLRAPIPAAPEAIRQLKSSPLALDLYIWSSYMTYRASRRDRPFQVSWKQLQRQFGSAYSDSRDFQKRARRHLEKIRLVYPGLRLRYGHGYLEIRPGRTAVDSTR